MGSVCKHIVASIFYLKKDELNILPKKKKRKSVATEFKEILDKVSHNDLKEFMQKHSKTDDNFRGLFLSTFAHLNQNQTKGFYQQQIKSIINSVTDRHGFIGWDEVEDLDQGIDPIIKIAEKQLENKNYKNAIYICTSIMEEMTEVFQYSDDHSGIIYGIIEYSCELLYSIAKKEISTEVKTELFNYCITTFESRLFDDWEWHMELLKIAYELTDNEENADIIIDCLGAETGDYEQERAQTFKLEIISKYKDDKEIWEFIEQHINNTSIRNIEIEKSIKNKNFEKAIKLCNDGIVLNEKDKPGLVKDWYNWLLIIAQSQKNRPKIIELARILFLINSMPKQNYYGILKKEIEPDRWVDFVEDLINEITVEGKWRQNDLIRKIFIDEMWWDRLFMLLKEDVTLQNIANNDQYLSSNYSQELIQLYSQKIVEYIAKNVGRNHYQTACKYLRRMKKIGGNKTVNKLIDRFKKEYPQRRALTDELSRV